MYTMHQICRDTIGPAVADDLKVKFHYLKTSQFSEIHVDGIFGGMAPNGKFIEMGIYAERFPIPVSTIHPISDDGTLGAEETASREGRDGIIRSVEANLIMNIETARMMAAWLKGKIKDLEDLTKKHASQPQPEDEHGTRTADK